MAPRRVTGALVSTAVASSLLLTAVSANAEEVKSPTPVGVESSQSQPESLTPAPSAGNSSDVSSAVSESVDPPEGSESIDHEEDTVEDPPVPEAEPSEVPLSTDAPESAETTVPSATPDPVVPSPVPSTAVTVQPSDTTKSESALTPTADPSPSSSVDTPFGFSDGDLTEEQKELLKKIDALEPKGSDNWSAEEWDAFYETPEGKAYDELWTELIKTLPEWEEEISEEEEAFWEMIDEMLPEGTDEWTDEQWEAFYETPEGKEIMRLISEFEVDHGDDWGIEISPEEQAFLDELEKRMPQDSENWTEEQWDEYFSTDEGHNLLEFYLYYEFDHAESPEQLTEMIEIYREFFDDGSGWYDSFVDVYLNGPEVGITDPPSESMRPSESTKPSRPASAEKPKKSAGIAPAARVIKAASERAQIAKHPVIKKAQNGNELADTGFSAGWMAVGGVLIVVLGAVIARRTRKNPARH